MENANVIQTDDTEAQPFSRHDIPHTVRNVISVAINTDTIDIFGLFELAFDHRDDWVMLVAEICNIAHCNRHSNLGAHGEVVTAAEKFWAETPVEELKRSWQ